jgi:hypothetical protein
VFLQGVLIQINDASGRAETIQRVSEPFTAELQT